jgi:VWFA-related protein
MRGSNLGFVAVLICLSTQGLCQQPVVAVQGRDQPPQAAQPPDAPDSAPVHRPPVRAMRLDVVVSDAAGKPVPGLTKQDFVLTDDNQPRAIVSFQAFDAATSKTGQPVQLILLIDLVNPGPDEVAAMRAQVVKALRQNGGHLAYPVSLVEFSPDGLQIQAQPSSDGNALATAVDQMKPGGNTDGFDRFDLSIQALTAIADDAMKRPGRKLLIWPGKGWPTSQRDDQGISSRENDANIDALVSLTNRLREARIVLYGGRSDLAARRSLVQDVSDLRQVDPANLALGTLALRSGGRSAASNTRGDLSAEIDSYVSDAGAYYTVSFEASPSKGAIDFHAIKLVIDRPGLNARTNAGYYAAPPQQKE